MFFPLVKGGEGGSPGLKTHPRTPTSYKIHDGAPTDGSSWETGTDNNRVLRGGSWDYNAVHCRSAFRVRNSADYRLRNWGFRVAVASVSSSS